MQARQAKDLRAPAFPDVPYSAYCKVCWQAQYLLWIDRNDDPKGECLDGHKDPTKCYAATAMHEHMATVAKARAAVTPNAEVTGRGPGADE
jgi:hypothetical protein